MLNTITLLYSYVYVEYNIYKKLEPFRCKVEADTLDNILLA